MSRRTNNLDNTSSKTKENTLSLYMQFLKDLKRI